MMEIKEAKKLIRETLYILVATAVIAIAANIAHPGGYILATRESLQEKRIIGISTLEAKIKFDRSSALFIDSRDRDEYIRKHIRNAIHLPALPESVSINGIKTNFSRLSEPLELVIYCDKLCNNSEVLARRLIHMGYSRHIYYLSDGYDEWEKMGFATD